MLRKLTILCAFCLLSAPAFATEADFEKRMARGVAALDAGDTTRAQEEFRAAIKEHPKDPEAALYLAIALNRANDPAAESALKTALRLEPGSPRINLELGSYYYNHSMYDEAGDYFENLLTLNPDPGMKAAAERYLATIRRQGSGKRWGVTLTGGMQYDTNVPLAADGVQLPVGIERKGDWRGVLNLGLTGVAYRDGEQELSGSYSLYQTLHLHLTDFNLTQNLLDVTYKRRLTPLLFAKASVGFESILLGGKQFVNDYRITPGLIATFREGMTTGLDYRFRGSTFKNTTMFPTNAERNGETHSIILSHRQRLSDIFNVRAGYRFERELADVSSWSSSAHLGNVGCAVSLPGALLLDLSVDAGTRKYDEIQGGASDIRTDTTVIGAASLTWQVAEHLGVSVGYHYTNNASNINGYEYSRGITSIMFQGRY
jgi:hypothetical protein